MRKTKKEAFHGGFLKACGFFFLLLSAHVYAQKRDTLPPGKNNVLNKILTNIITPKKDTVKPKDNNPPANPNKEITPNKVPANNNVIVNPAVVNNNAIGLLNRFPDTLIMGSYLIVVENYDKGGEWSEVSKAWLHLNGTGRLKFTCLSKISILPPIWKNAVLKPVSLKVVDNAFPGNNEISAKDAASLGLNAQPGSTVEVMMPHYNDKSIGVPNYLSQLRKEPDGIRVRFSDLAATPIKPGAAAGQVSAGIAVYPSESPLPAVPFTLNLASGFSLDISAITFSPVKYPVVTAVLNLPPSLTQNSGCRAASLNLGDIVFSPSCEFYKELPDSTYGIFGVGNTTLAIQGRGYVADFSSTQAYGPSGKPVNWKGVVLMQGESRGTNGDDVISNIGYLQADYRFSNGLVESSGLTAAFQLATSPYHYGTAQPFGYNLSFSNAEVDVASSAVSGGFLRNGEVILPKTAVRQANNSPVVISDMSLTIKPTMDVSGFALIRPDMSVYWGDLIAAGGGDRKSFGIVNATREVLLFFSATPQPAFMPTGPGGKNFMVPFTTINAAAVETYNMQGATITSFNTLVINSAWVPHPRDPNNPGIPANNNPIWFLLNNNSNNWMNVVTEGVHCTIAGAITQTPGPSLGDSTKPLYVGGTSFKTPVTPVATIKEIPPFSSIVLQCVESAVITCDYRSLIVEPMPVNRTLAFKEMVFTSTANNAGGKLVVGSSDSLAYWGLKLVPKPGFSSAGLISVRTGQVILTAAGLAEYRHFAQPFWLTWGEMLANGNMGRLFFDFNSAGQQFDQFNYVHDAVALSPYDPSKKGFLRVGGNAHFPFFGGDYLHIIDTYNNSLGSPYDGRVITLSPSSFSPGFSPTNFNIGGNWNDGLGIFHFTLQYASLMQDGFKGDGTSLLRNLITSGGGGGGGSGGGGGHGASFTNYANDDRATADGDIFSTLEMNSHGTCIRIGSNLMDTRAISLGPVANVSEITRIWGCVCITHDGIDNLVVGGEITTSANFSVVARVGSYLSAILQVSPSLARVTIDGEATLSVALSLDADINGHMQLTMNFAEGFLEGEVSGKINVAGGTGVLGGSSLQAEGQLNWHLGLDFTELQGMVGLKMMSSVGIPGLGAGAGMGISAAFYIGHMAPKTRAWVLVGGDPRFSLNMAPLPDHLTGIYGSLHVEQSVNIAIISGGYEITVGLGAFVLEPTVATALGALSPGLGLPYVVGNLGGRVHGEILGGLVSAGAYFNLSVIGPYPFGFEGRVGLEACVLWVACGSVDVTIGLNSSEGFYIR